MAPAPFINSALVDLARRDDALIVFPHTQRTGGKALRDQVLCVAYGPQRVYSASRGTGSKSWQDVTNADLVGFTVYTGPSNFADLNKGRPAVFVGLLRHPLYRAVSQYHYCRKREGHPLHEIANRCSLEHFYSEAARVNPPYMRNTQCLRLCGAADAKLAQRTIAGKYIGIGFTADIAEFASSLGALLQWPHIELNSVSSDEERYEGQLTASFRAQVLDGNAEDLKLYEWVAAGLPPAARRKSFLSIFR